MEIRNTDGLVLHVVDSVSFAGGQLQGLNLRGASLHQADLTGVDLSGSSLAGANLSWATLRGARLHGCILCRANLTGADLTAADCDGANFSRANMRAVVLRDADLRRAVFTQADLKGALQAGARLPEPRPVARPMVAPPAAARVAGVLVQCPECKALVKPSNLTKHLAKVHSVSHDRAAKTNPTVLAPPARKSLSPAKKSLRPAPQVTASPSPPVLKQCPQCRANVRSDRLPGHQQRVHGGVVSPGKATLRKKETLAEMKARRAREERELTWANSSSRPVVDLSVQDRRDARAETDRWRQKDY